MMNEEDENIKKAKQAADLVMMQNKARDYQNKMLELQNKEYQGKYQGLFLRMKGNFEVIDVRIEQSFYETAGKGQIEKAILAVTANLHRAIEADQKLIQDEMQNDLTRMQMDAMSHGNN